MPVEVEARLTWVLETTFEGAPTLSCDCTVVIAEQPRLQPHLAEMALRLADRLGVDQDLVGVKATSPEGLGALGRREAIAAQAVVLIDSV